MRRSWNRIQKLQKLRILKHSSRKKQQKNEKQELQMRSVLREFLLKKSIWNFLRKRNSALSVVPHWKKSGKSLSAGNWFLYRQNWKYMNTTVRAMSARSAGFRIFWCATRQVDKLNNENFSSPVQFMYRVVYATLSSFCSWNSSGVSTPRFRWTLLFV